MDKAILERWLAEGLSLEQMGERAGRHASTMSYWLTKHGLRASGRDLHRARGRVPRERLAELVAADLSVRQIADRVDRSPATVQYWLRRYELQTTPAARARRVFPDRRERRPGTCHLHGDVEFVVDRRGTPLCPRCRLEAVARWRRRAKATLIEEAGGCCATCGYDACQEALQFHHLDPSTKRFALGGRGLTRSLDVLREEASKCVLLCARCHVEVEHGHRSLPATMSHSEPGGSDVVHDPG